MTNLRHAIITLTLGFAACGLAACGTTVKGSGGSGGEGGGGSSTSSGGNADATPQSFCEAKVARDEKCNPGSAGTVAECLASPDTSCIFSGIRPEVRGAVVSCLTGRPCDQIDDTCYYEPGLANPAAGQDDYLSACAAKVAACGTTFSDDYCSVTILKAESYTALSACLALDCASVGACLDGAVQAICPGN